jgi:CDGSH iron-sulfur domain-containing protein 3
MSDKVQIRIKENGSIRINGTVDIVDSTGNVIEVKSDFSLCRCGHSKEKPFCDGSHKGNFEAAEGLGN